MLRRGVLKIARGKKKKGKKKKKKGREEKNSLYQFRGRLLPPTGTRRGCGASGGGKCHGSDGRRRLGLSPNADGTCLHRCAGGFLGGPFFFFF